jgi:ATP-dependent DNA ligase
MVRNTKFPYENKRSKSLLKWKRFEDEEFRIVEINEGQGNRTGLATEAVLSLPDGKTFSAGIIGNDDYSRNLYNNREKVKNLRATVKFQGKTNTGIPRFGKMKIVRYEGF